MQLNPQSDPNLDPKFDSLNSPRIFEAFSKDHQGVVRNSVDMFHLCFIFSSFQDRFIYWVINQGCAPFNFQFLLQDHDVGRESRHKLNRLEDHMTVHNVAPCVHINSYQLENYRDLNKYVSYLPGFRSTHQDDIFVLACSCFSNMCRHKTVGPGLRGVILPPSPPLNKNCYSKITTIYRF